ARVPSEAASSLRRTRAPPRGGPSYPPGRRNRPHAGTPAALVRRRRPTAGAPAGAGAEPVRRSAGDADPLDGALEPARDPVAELERVLQPGWAAPVARP